MLIKATIPFNYPAGTGVAVGEIIDVEDGLAKEMVACNRAVIPTEGEITKVIAKAKDKKVIEHRDPTEVKGTK